MKKLALGAALALGLLVSAPALAQTNKMHTGAAQHINKQMASPMGTMMSGLNASERAIAMAHYKKMTSAERAVMMKRCQICRADKHAGMEKMKPTQAMFQQHLMSGLTPAEQTTMSNMWSKMSPKEKAVATKMVKNCCMYGMKHAK